MPTTEFQKKQISREVDKVINSGFSIDMSRDTELLDDKPYDWNDINILKDELGNSIIQFLGQVNSIITNPDVISNLKDKKEHFEKLINIFFTDINDFSHKVKELREQHEGMSGHVKDINEFNNYNRIAITYHSMYNELLSLITPTLSELVLVISEVVPNVNLTDNMSDQISSKTESSKE